jgi:putative ABC transport system ATP-binding protein
MTQDDYIYFYGISCKYTYDIAVFLILPLYSIDYKRLIYHFSHIGYGNWSDILEEVASFQSVTVAYPGKTVLSGFSFSFAEGEKVLLRGKSGSGKSTLFSYLLGYSQPAAGSVLFRGETITSAGIGAVRGSFSYVPQNTDVGEGNVREFLGEIFSYASTPGMPDVPALAGIFRQFDLDPSLLDSDFSDLSGGEKQRLLLATSVMLGRDIFLLDEPTASLDPALKETVAEYFTSDPSLTVLVISHDPQWEAGVDRIVELDGTT